MTGNARAEGDSSKMNWSSFAEKLLLLLIGFVLTTWLGTFIGGHYNRESAKKEAELAFMQSDLTQAMQTFQSISQLMDKRLFSMRRLHDVYSGVAGKDALNQRLADY